MKFTIETDNHAEAAAMLEHIVARSKRGVEPTSPAKAAVLSSVIAPESSNTDPTPQIAAPPITPAPASTITAKQVLDAMGAWKQAGNGVEGVKRILTQCNITKIPDASPQQLEWLYQVFTNKVSA